MQVHLSKAAIQETCKCISESAIRDTPSEAEQGTAATPGLGSKYRYIGPTARLPSIHPSISSIPIPSIFHRIASSAITSPPHFGECPESNPSLAVVSPYLPPVLSSPSTSRPHLLAFTPHSPVFASSPTPSFPLYPSSCSKHICAASSTHDYCTTHRALLRHTPPISVRYQSHPPLAHLDFLHFPLIAIISTSAPQFIQSRPCI